MKLFIKSLLTGLILTLTIICNGQELIYPEVNNMYMVGNKELIPTNYLRTIYVDSSLEKSLVLFVAFDKEGNKQWSYVTADRLEVIKIKKEYYKLYIGLHFIPLREEEGDFSLPITIQIID